MKRNNELSEKLQILQEDIKTKDKLLGDLQRGFEDLMINLKNEKKKTEFLEEKTKALEEEKEENIDKMREIDQEIIGILNKRKRNLNKSKY